MTALQAPYGLIFENLPDEIGAGRTLLGWDGEWPPPDRMHVFIGQESGERAYVGSDEIDTPEWAPKVAEVRATPSITEHVFILRSCSTFTKETAGDHIWPCAQYIEQGQEYAGDGRVREARV